MSLATFQSLAGSNEGRCSGAASQAQCNADLSYALSMQLITTAAYNWGLANGYYPVVDRHNQIGAICKCGCFEANALILTESVNGASNKWIAAKDVTKDTKLVSLDETSKLSRPGMKSQSVKALTHGKELPALYVFSLSNGRDLKVTQNHGMLLSDGRVVEAKTLSAGAEFVGLDGSTVRVNTISFERTKREVFNFEVDTQSKQGHIIAAEGVLVGDLAWQNQLSSELGAISIRR
ncbi:Hint domain-containing protein [Stigmatella aurantiaca]|nr:Hint domain-containing protein [Stigmatella aurantiaca]